MTSNITLYKAFCEIMYYFIKARYNNIKFILFHIHFYYFTPLEKIILPYGVLQYDKIIC